MRTHNTQAQPSHNQQLYPANDEFKSPIRASSSKQPPFIQNPQQNNNMVMMIQQPATTNIMKKRLTGHAGQSASKKKNNNLLNSQNNNYQSATNANSEMQGLTTVNYFISNPNFAPQQSTTNNIIIMNKRLGSSNGMPNAAKGLPTSSASIKRKQQPIKSEEGGVPKQGGGHELVKLFGNEKNFQLIKSLMDTGSQQTSALSGPRTIAPNNQNSSFTRVNAIKKPGHEENHNDKEIKIEKALLDLNDLKNQMFDEKSKAHKDLSPSNATRPKMNTVTNNFFRETGFSTASANNKFGQAKPMTTTQGAFFSSTGTNFNPAHSLTSNIENLDSTQLKERLLVAETLMKKLYNRNKELEAYHQNQLKGSTSSQDFALQAKTTIDQDENFSHQQNNGNQRETELLKELEEKQKEIERLNQELQIMAKEGSNNDQKGSGTYIHFLESRLQETQAETKRMLSKYSEMRVFAYNQLETLIIQSQKTKPQATVTSNLSVYKQVIERERKHFESESTSKNAQMEEANQKAKRLYKEAEALRERVAELEQEIVERDACEAQVQEYVKQLIAEKNNK